MIARCVVRRRRRQRVPVRKHECAGSGSGGGCGRQGACLNVGAGRCRARRARPAGSWAAQGRRPATATRRRAAKWGGDDRGGGAVRWRGCGGQRAIRAQQKTSRSCGGVASVRAGGRGRAGVVEVGRPVERASASRPSERGGERGPIDGLHQTDRRTDPLRQRQRTHRAALNPQHAASPRNRKNLLRVGWFSSGWRATQRPWHDNLYRRRSHPRKIGHGEVVDHSGAQAWNGPGAWRCS